MSFLKFKADKIFDGYRFLDQDAVLVTEMDGTIVEIVKGPEAGDDIQLVTGILSPGFINCHCHLELSHMRGLIPKDTGLVQFVTDVISKRHFPAEAIFDAIAKAEKEMVDNGIVAVGDICNNDLSIPQKRKGNLLYQNFIEASGYHPSVVNQRFERALDILKVYEKHFPANRCSIAPHAPYSVGEELWDLIINYPGNDLLTIHNQETEGENEWFETKTGEFTKLYENLNIDTGFFEASNKSSLKTYLHKFKKDQSVILVHNVHTSEPDLAYCQLPIVLCQLSWCLCPNANKYISGQMPPVELFRKYNCDIVLGTDSLASNDHLSIWEEIITLREYFPGIALEEMLKWATSNGARAMKMEESLGSFEKGKKPGLVWINENAKKLI